MPNTFTVRSELDESTVRAVKRSAAACEDWRLVDDCRLALGEVQIAAPAHVAAARARVQQAISELPVEVLPSPDAPATLLLRYDTLTLRRSITVTVREWRELAVALRAAASMVHPAFQGRYLSRAVNCTAMVADMAAMSCGRAAV